jgi:hypothetical protein
MPEIKARLESSELTNNPKAIQSLLDACLASDPAHIKPHQKGEHVKIIQRALTTISERAPEIGLPTIKDKPGEYESDTIAAVLKYKSHFQLVRAGQPLDPIVGRMTITHIDNDLLSKKAPPSPEPDPATDPAEKGRVEILLALNRPAVPILIARALDALSKCKAALELARRDPFQAQFALRQNQLGIDGLNRHFHISGNNLEVIDTVVSTYSTLLQKVPRLPLDQAATDYPTFTRDAPELVFNADGTRAKVPAFSDPTRGKMFFNPIYRQFNPAAKEPFSGLAPIALQGVQLHEMGHFYLNMVDGNPANATTAQCLNLAQSFQLFAMQLALGRPFP